MKLILGSASPRRKEILAQVGIVPFEIRAPNVDEAPLKKELPLQYCMRIAEKKIQNNKAKKVYAVAGGGDTVSLINSLNGINNFDFVSTAGGAFLEYLEGKELPGIKALN